MYQDNRENNQIVNIIVKNKENNQTVYSTTKKTDIYGSIEVTVSNLQLGLYDVIAIHPEDRYYKEITNKTLINVSKCPNPFADLEVSKIVNATLVNSGDTIKWTITVTNKGPDTAVNAYVIDVLPAGLEYQSHTPSMGTYDKNTGKWTIGNLTNGQSVTLDIITLVKTTNTTIVNIAIANSSTPDPNETNNKGNNSIKSNPLADLEIRKTSDKRLYKTGDLIIWTIIVTNKGPDTSINTYVIDKLPKNCIYLYSNLTKGTYNEKTNKWTIGNLLNGEKAVLYIVCKATNSGVIINYVSVTNDIKDPNLNNNYDNCTITISEEQNVEPIKPNNTFSKDYIPMKSTGHPLGLIGIIVLIFIISIIPIKVSIWRRKKY